MRQLLIFLLLVVSANAEPFFVDHRAVLRLAGARHEEIEFARLQHVVAVQESKQAWQRFWPTLSIGANYRGHEGRLQDHRALLRVVEGRGVSRSDGGGHCYFRALLPAVRQCGESRDGVSGGSS